VAIWGLGFFYERYVELAFFFFIGFFFSVWGGGVVFFWVLCRFLT